MDFPPLVIPVSSQRVICRMAFPTILTPHVRSGTKMEERGNWNRTNLLPTADREGRLLALK
ncbi:MAG: hypothetical protein DMG38_10565 [Acidobacteria bacterium]|nr:MAG: hypothetical protein DMG38_10565 [Acidobacteriota bacterium]